MPEGVRVIEAGEAAALKRFKEFTAKGEYTSAAYTLHYLLSVVRSTLARKAAIVEEHKAAAAAPREQITNG
jgi:hypothetical protein